MTVTFVKRNNTTLNLECKKNVLITNELKDNTKEK